MALCVRECVRAIHVHAALACMVSVTNDGGAWNTGYYSILYVLHELHTWEFLLLMGISSMHFQH